MAKNELAVIRWARTQRAGHTIAKAVLLVLASHADRYGVAFPSQRTIAEEAEVSPASTNRAVKLLIEKGLIAVVKVGAGRSAAGYQLAVDGPVSVSRTGTQSGSVASHPDETQMAFDSVPPGGNASDDRSVSPGARSVSSGARSVSQQGSDQQVSGPEVLPTEVEEEPPEEAAARLSRADAHASATPARTRGRGGSSERVPAGELDRTAHSGSAFVLVAAWVERHPGVANGHRRELGRAVDELLRSRADPALIPDALDEAHDPRFRNPVKALPLAYEDVRRRAAARTRPPRPEDNPNDARVMAFLNGPPTQLPPALGGPSC